MTKLLDVVKNSIEATEPQNKILAFLETVEGKALTERHAQKMREEIDPSIRITKQHGWTSIKWGAYAKCEGEMFIAYTDKNVKIDVQFIRENNARYFLALDERNAKRNKILEHGDSVLNEFATVAETFLKLQKRLKELTEHDKMLNVCRYELLEAVGVDYNHL